MEMKIPAIAITALVVVVVLAGVLMPVLDDATTNEDTFKNDGLWRMKEIANGDAWEYSRTGPTVTYNGVEQTGVLSDAGTNWILGDTWCVRTNGNARGASMSGSSIQSITATAGEVNIIFTGVTGTTTQDLPGYGLDNNGAFILKAYDKDAYVQGDSVIYGTGQSTIDNYQFMAHVSGSIDDGVSFTIFPQRNSAEMDNIEYGEVVIESTPVKGYEDLYSLTSVSCDVSFTTGSDDTLTSYSGKVTYSSFVVPYEVTAERSVHFTDNENAIFAAIPIMVIVALLIAVVALVFRGRNF